MRRANSFPRNRGKKNFKPASDSRKRTSKSAPESTGRFASKDHAKTPRSSDKPRDRSAREPFLGKKSSSSERHPQKKKFRDKSTNDNQEKKGTYKKHYRPRSVESSYSKFSSDKRKQTPSKEIEKKVGDKIRLNKYIANSGVCSRREADELIQMGLVSVNGKVITELGYKVNLTDEVKYENKLLRAEKTVYILLNKPKGYLTTTNDPQERDTVMHLIGKAVKERVYPVGRLDRNTTGLLLITNDGDLAEKLSHPSYNVKKIYKVELDRALTKVDFQKILEGIKLEEGRALVDDLAIISDDGRTIGIELHIGWNRVVRRIFETLNYQVVKLDRSVYAGLDKKELPRGKWRFLRNEEVIKLKHFK
jgi:23S rRNA pseudouridine2605 synthase